VAAHIDREDIQQGEAWWERLQQLITESDAIMFVLSPASIASPICQQEVAFAESLNKRLVPVVAKELGALRPPPALERLNYIFFIPKPRAGARGDFNRALKELIAAPRSLPYPPLRRSNSRSRCSFSPILISSPRGTGR